MISKASILQPWFVNLWKFCTCVDHTFLVPNVSGWQSLERQQEIMIWSSTLHKEKFICRLIIKFISLIFYQLQLLWTCWIFTSYFMILKIFYMSLFGHFQLWASTRFQKWFALDMTLAIYDTQQKFKRHWHKIEAIVEVLPHNITSQSNINPILSATATVWTNPHIISDQNVQREHTTNPQEGKIVPSTSTDLSTYELRLHKFTANQNTNSTTHPRHYII